MTTGANDDRDDLDEYGHSPRWTAPLTNVVLARPWVTIVVAALLALGGGVCGWFRLPLDADTDSLISPSRSWMREYLDFLEEFGDLEYLYAVIDTHGAEPAQRAAGEAAVDDVVTRLRAIPALPGVFGRIEPEEQWRLATRAMADAELRGLASAADAIPMILHGSAGGILAQANASLERLLSPAALAMDDATRERLGAGALLELEALASSVDLVDGREPSFGIGQRPKAEYLRSDSGKLLFVAIKPRKDFSTLGGIEAPLRAVRAALAEAQARHPDVDIGLTGKPVLQADEMETSTGDTMVSFGVGLAVVAALCVFIYRNVRRPALALLAFAIALGWCYGAAALLVGRLTLLSMVFMLVLIGAGLDYGIHVVSRHIEFRARHPVLESVRRTMRSTAGGTLTGAATSAAVFGLAILSNFQGLRELGIVAGVGLMLCALAMVTVLPALLALFDSKRLPKVPHEIPVPGARVGHDLRAARWSVAAFAALTVAALIVAPLRLRFENNLLALQAQDLDSVRWERRVLADSASLSWFAAVRAPDESSALAAIERAKKEATIAFIRSPFDLVRPDSAERQAARKRIVDASTREPAPGGPEVEAAALEQAAQRVSALRSLAAGKADVAELARIGAISERLAALATRARADLEAVRAASAGAVDRSRAALREIAVGAAAPLREALPVAVRERMVSPSGTLLVTLIPKGDAWELEPLRAFVEAIRRVDPHATGVPVTQSESIRDMTRAFVRISLWSVLVVAALTWLDFRSLRAVALCVSVLLVGIALTLGALAAFDVPLSLANFFGIPILIGLGIDSNIHLLHRARESRAHEVHFGGTRSAVIFTALTTAIGFGGQIFASHRGMQGLGWIMVVGSLICLATSVWLLPALLRLRILRSH